MSIADNKILNSYYSILEHLTAPMKISLIEKLTASLKKKGAKKTRMMKAFGAFQSDESAEDIIKSIADSRNFSREIEDFD